VKHQKIVWMLTGLVAGLGIAQFWPHEPVRAATADRDDKFGMTTCPVSFVDGTEGVFVIDYLTGQLKGGMVNPRMGVFTNFYFRNLAADFNVDPKAEPHYAMVAGARGQNIGQAGRTLSAGTIYVAELTSGQVVAYTFPYVELRKVAPPVQMTPMDKFQFREPVIRD
jgi:hypothetical protein